jgi:hypothetical protein
MTDSQGRGYVLAFVCILLPFLVVRARWLAPLCGLAMSALLFTDLSVANVNTYSHPYRDAPACYHQHQSAVETARQQSLGGRVLIASRDLDTGLPANLGMLTGLPVVGAAHLPLTKDQATWWRNLISPDSATIPDHLVVSREASGPALLDFMATRVALVASDAPLSGGNWQQNGPRLRLAEETGTVRVFVNEDAYPRAYWTSSCLPVSSTQDAVGALVSGKTRPAKGCTVQALPGSPSSLQHPQAPAGTSSGQSGEEPTCSVEDVSTERVVVRVQAPTDGLTVLADTLAPGWKARLDGKPCPILQANGLFRGIATPPGQHEIVFEYRPPGYRVGRAVSLAGLAMFACLGLVIFSRNIQR